jgi:hypothetical protein
MKLYKDDVTVSSMREGVKAAKERQAKSVNDGRASKVDGKHQAELKEGEMLRLKLMLESNPA